MNFEDLILQDGFGAVSFDLWILLVRYEIPSIFISSVVIPETSFKNKEFVCYLDDKHDDRFAFIVIPAMYKRHEMKNPEYKLLVNDQKQIQISLRALNQSECLQNIDEAIHRVYSVKNYIDELFKKRKTTIHPARKPNAVIEFVEVTNENTETPEIRKQIPEEPKIFKLKKGRKLKLEEDEAIEDEAIAVEAKVAATNEESEEFEEIEVPVKAVKVKGKTRRNAKIKVNPPGKTKKNRIAPENIDFVEVSNTTPSEDNQ